jgi:hypothetical protein
MEEVEIFFKEMVVGKSPGPDGYTTNLLQTYWKIIA